MGLLAGISLFSGIGGIDLALAGYAETVCYVEWDAYCQRVLQARIRDGLLADAPIWDDIRTFDGRPYRGAIDIVSGGFPCQDVSVAGRRAGIDGARSGLWTEMHRLVCEIRPRFVFVENVPGLLSAGFGRVLGDLAASGYDAEWLCLQAAEVGAPHRRKRVFVLAHATELRRERDTEKPRGTRESQNERRLPESERRSQVVAHASGSGCRRRQDEQGEGQTQRGRASISGEDMADSFQSRLEGRECLPERAGQRASGPGSMADANLRPSRGLPVGETAQDAMPGIYSPDYWRIDPADVPESGMGRVVAGLPHRVDRLRCLGNAVVPLQARTAFEMLVQEIARHEPEKEGEGQCR